MGISKFAVDQLTDLIVIDLPKLGATLTKGKPFGEVESVKAVSDLYAPVGGEVVEVNDAVTKDVQILAEDPYTKGWLVKVKVADVSPIATLSSTTMLTRPRWPTKPIESGPPVTRSGKSRNEFPPGLLTRLTGLLDHRLRNRTTTMPGQESRLGRTDLP